MVDPVDKWVVKEHCRYRYDLLAAAPERLRKTYEIFGNVLNGFGDIVGDYIEYDGDHPYVYNEKTNVAMFCGAAWRNGYLIIQEMPSEKRRGKKIYRGLIDILLGTGNGNWCAFEAKIYSPDFGYDKKYIADCISRSKLSAESIQSDYINEKFGLSFFCPRLPVAVAKKESRGNANICCSNYMEQLYIDVQESKPDASLCVIAKNVENTKEWHDSFGDCYWPGVAICINRVR